MTETWKIAAKYLSSLLILDRDDDRPASSFHGSFIPAVAENFILRLTSVGDWIYDPFAGSGTSKIVSEELGRDCVLSDINPIGPHVIFGDARYTKVDPPVQLIILHPPYHDIVQFSDPPLSGDLSHCETLDNFYNLWTAVCLNMEKCLKPGGYIGLICGDIWIAGKDNSFVEPLAHNCMTIALAALGPGAKLKAIQVKNITGNQAFEKHKNFLLSRFYRWGAVRFETEMMYSIQKGK